MPIPLESNSLKKIYRNKGRTTTAINNFTFSVKDKGVFSLLGRNGSGKTTFVKVSTTQLTPDDGYVRVFGKDVVNDEKELRHMISLVPQESRPFPHMTPYEHVYLFQKMNGKTREESKDRAESVIGLLGMEDFAKVECVNLSGGQKQLTMVAMALSLDAQIYFLDEPTIGLDIITRKRVWNAINKYRNAGKSIFLTTHYLDEAAILSDEIGIVSHGNFIKQGTLDELRSGLEYDTRVAIRGRTDAKDFEQYGRVYSHERSTVIFTNQENVEKILSDSSVRKERIEIGPVGLDDVFISLVGEDIEVDEN
ncbi:MAG: ABC transporter ATP-binding protein [Candidatus Thermoplasmatota archaeon]|jgi:ABC-2 type transport system ATP-binding protein|nr:ABC transporter ATP-binding protein [Candidatus Thermoplasmatota archaeon]